jgi:DnaB-like helicase N terminal domain/DnaB-like helicase C terminal domain
MPVPENTNKAGEGMTDALVLPHDDNIERAVLTSLLMEGTLAQADEVGVDDFYTPKHREIFSAMLRAHEDGDKFDLLSLSKTLNGLSPYLAELASQWVTSANLRYHIRLLRIDSFKRIVLKKNVLIIARAREGDLTPEDLKSLGQEIIDSYAFFMGEQRETGVMEALRQFISVTEGDFSVTDCVQTVKLSDNVTNRDAVTTRDKTKHRAAIRKALQRLKEQGVIVPTGKKEGYYRRVDNEAETLDWWNASSEHIDLSFPMEVEGLCVLQPRNIAIVAGQKDAGKTAFLLNFTARNIDKHRKIHYFSSEMAPSELKSRLLKFENFPIDEWRKVDFRDRNGNFSDVIFPDDINVIDFLEISDEFYKISAMIRAIYDKLNKGICIIALQKNPGQTLGLGGARSIEKARLYISLNHEFKRGTGEHRNWARIESGKNRVREEVNPVGLEREYKLVRGYKFVSQEPWHMKGERL